MQVERPTPFSFCYNVEMHYVYIIKSEKFDKLYIGFSSDLKRRFAEHNMGLSTYTKSFLPWKLVYYEAYTSKTDAQDRERQFKKTC